MADFSTSVDLELEVSSRSLRSARSTIEQELGDIEIGVTAGAGGGRQQGQLAGILDANRRQFELAEQRNDLLDEIKDSLDSGGGGGGSGLFAGGFAGGAARGSVALGGFGVAAGGIGLAALGVHGSRAALGSGALGETGRRVAGERELITGLSGLELLTEDQGEAAALMFKNVLDPTGIGETLATEAAQGIMDQTSLDEEITAGFSEGASNIESAFRDAPDLAAEFEWPSLPRGLESFLGGGGTPTATSIGLAPSDQRLVNEANRGGRRGGFGVPDINVDVGDIVMEISPTVGNALDNAMSTLEDVQSRLDEFEKQVDRGLSKYGL